MSSAVLGDFTARFTKAAMLFYRKEELNNIINKFCQLSVIEYYKTYEINQRVAN